jgi:hypothetical protein
METKTFLYKGYLVELKAEGYSIKKDGKFVLLTEQTFPFPSEAEVHAKLCINRLISNNDGWVVS